MSGTDLQTLIDICTDHAEENERENQHLPLLKRSVAKVVPRIFRDWRKALSKTSNKVSVRPLRRGRARLKRTRKMRRRHLSGVIYRLISTGYSLGGVLMFVFWLGLGVTLAGYTLYQVFTIATEMLTQATAPPEPPGGSP